MTTAMRASTLFTRENAQEAHAYNNARIKLLVHLTYCVLAPDTEQRL